MGLEGLIYRGEREREKKRAGSKGREDDLGCSFGVGRVVGRCVTLMYGMNMIYITLDFALSEKCR